ncbi:MAG: hypothetical protein KTR33_03970 [Gammaproteobacteria bacterium]|nr:hypothetical protein [Gammaproteobacteria bacterium]
MKPQSYSQHKRSLASIAVSLLGLVMFLASAPAWSQVTLFPECNFLGKPVTLPSGSYNRKELARLGIYDDSISSIVVSEGYGVSLHTNDNYSGRFATLTGIMQCLDAPFNNSISSLRIGFAEDIEALNAEAANPPTPAGVGVTVFSECGYRGRSSTLGNGEYSAADLRAFGVVDNSISSVKVPKGMSIALYLNDFQRGRSGKLSADSECLPDRFNDTVSSVVVSGQMLQPAVVNTAAAAEVFTACNYRGEGARLAEGEYMAADLARLGIPDNAVASIRAPAGMEVHIFVNDFLRGRSAAVTGDQNCLTGTRFEGEVSSIKVFSGSSSAAKRVSGVTLYADCYYSGQSVTLPVGEYDARALAANGLADNTISSIKIPKGYRLTGYENDFYRGGSLALAEDEECLTRRRADDTISSVVIESATATPVQKKETALSAEDRQFLSTGLACVNEFVQQGLCITQAWPLIVKNCRLDRIPRMTDGYLEDHVDAGNCVPEKWKELSHRTANPGAR